MAPDCSSEKDVLRRCPTPPVEDNQLLEITGPYGRWQFYITIFLLIGNLFSAINALSGSFYAPNVDYWCARPAQYQNWSIDQWKKLVGNTTILHCYEYEHPEVKCSHWEYDLSFYKNTIIDEWNLVCDRSWLVSATKACYMLGAMISVILFGQLADIFGRYRIVWICLSMELIAGTLSSWTNSIYLYIFFRFLVAVGESGKWSTGYVLLLEVTGSSYRNLIGNGIQLGWATGYVIIPAMAYYVPDYKSLQLISILPEVILFAWFNAIPESPRWLLTKNRTNEVVMTLHQAAKTNKRPTDNIEEKVALAQQKIQKENLAGSLSLFGLFKTPNLRRKTIILYFSWFVNAFVYYGLSFNTNDLGGNAYVNFLIAGAVEFPAYLLVIYVSSRFGRRSSLISLTLLAGLACVACAPIAENDSLLTLRLIFAMAGKFFVTASFGLIYLYTAELFPTVARNAGVGSCSMIARFGSTIAPFVKELGDMTHLSVPMGIFGALAIADTFFLLILPETKNREMPDSLDQAENS